ncbi:hypothetical protein AAIR98_001318 [Elusimicrobium simillimum]|uniref:hypothetical protein n=1 Tax=Elusimicrobium simillimum TaxID=3143438 RepID=UPI003C6FB616
MKDITEIRGGDIALANTEVPRAKNLFEVQIGVLQYFADWGIDLEYFLDPNYQIQNTSFNSYLTQKLGEWGFSVSKLVKEDGKFAEELNFTFCDNQKDTMMRG